MAAEPSRGRRRGVGDAAGGCWPTREQVLLLQAALWDGSAAVSAWRQWRDVVDLDRLDPGSYRLLPLLWHNLHRMGVEDPLLARCRGIFRHTWSRNHLRLHRVRPALEALQAAAIPVLVLKGGAMAARYYPGIGARPMNDLDVMVPPQAAAAARRLLERLGWRPALQLPDSYLPYIHALGYVDPAGAELDLHWHPLWEVSRPHGGGSWWRDAVPLELAGVQVLTLDHTDHLVQVCVHGLRWSDAIPVHWVADAFLVLERSGGAIDWDRVLDHARAERLGLQLWEALRLVREGMEAPVPPEVLDRLRALPTGPSARLELWARLRPPSLARGLLLHWFDHRRRSGGGGLVSRLIGFPLYLQTAWGLSRLREVPATLVRKTVRRLRRS